MSTAIDEVSEKKGVKSEGIVTDSIYPGDVDTEPESIIVNCAKGKLVGKSVEFRERDIQSISETR